MNYKKLLNSLKLIKNYELILSKNKNKKKEEDYE